MLDTFHIRVILSPVGDVGKAAAMRLGTASQKIKENSYEKSTTLSSSSAFGPMYETFGDLECPHDLCEWLPNSQNASRFHMRLKMSVSFPPHANLII